MTLNGEMAFILCYFT